MLMLATFILFLREGLEASLIVSILFAVLRQLRLTHQARAVWTGVGLAIIGSLIAGVVVYLTVHAYANTLLQQVFETVAYLVAVVLLTTMTFWMQKHSRSMKKEITVKASAAGSGFALGLLAFTTVGREGVETAFFTLAFAFQTNGWILFAAGLLGDAVQNMQTLGWLPFGTTPLWNTAHILSEDSTIGDILHTFLGYAQAPTVLQS